MMIRSKPNRRKYKRRLTISLMLVMMILLAVITSASISAFEWLRGGFLSSAIFTLKGVSIQGNRRVNSADILDAANLHVGTDSTYSIMSHIVEKRIKARFRYLERVEVQRRMDGWVTIAVKEREPVALIGFGRDDDSFMVIDAHGFILEQGVKRSYGDMPVIVGVDGRTLLDTRKPESRKSGGPAFPLSRFPAIQHPASLNLALDVLTNARSLIPELFGEISHIDARDPDNIILHLRTRNESMPRVTIRIASDRIKEGLSNIQHVIIKRREEDRVRSDAAGLRVPVSPRSPVSFDARFPGAVYCNKGDA